MSLFFFPFSRRNPFWKLFPHPRPLGKTKNEKKLGNEQIGIDQLDQNKAVNKRGGVVGAFKGASLLRFRKCILVTRIKREKEKEKKLTFPQKKSNQIKSGGEGKVDTASSLAPYDDVFSLARFRENELIHGRWAMLAALGALVAEGTTGISWADATKVELESASYLGLPLPFSTTALAYINPVLIGGAELYRNTATEPEDRCYPGGAFDPLGLGSGDPDRVFKLREAELKHGRLAMIACLGFGVQALAFGEGALGSLKKFI